MQSSISASCIASAGRLLSWLCTNPQASAQLTYHGISLTEAEIVEDVNLYGAKIPFPISATSCLFRGTIGTGRSHMSFLNLAASSVNQLKANTAHFEEELFLRDGFKAEGGVDLIAAKIDGNFECDGGHFVSKGATPAINADSAKIDGSVYFRAGFAAEGEVRFLAAYVGHHFQWSAVKSPEKSALDLRYSKVGTLLNSAGSWPAQGWLHVDGFVYDQFEDTARPKAKVQLGWLKLQPRDRFLSQPFEQLAAVLRKMGHDEDAKLVMISNGSVSDLSCRSINATWIAERISRLSAISLASHPCPTEAGIGGEGQLFFRR